MVVWSRIWQVLDGVLVVSATKKSTTRAAGKRVVGRRRDRLWRRGGALVRRSVHALRREGRWATNEVRVVARFGAARVELGRDPARFAVARIKFVLYPRCSEPIFKFVTCY